MGSGDAAHIITVYAPAAMLAATVAAEQPEEAVPGTLLGFQRNQIWRLQQADPTFADVIIALQLSCSGH